MGLPALSQTPGQLQACINSTATSCTLSAGSWYISATVTNPNGIHESLPPWGLQTYYPPITVGSPGSPFTRGNLTIDGHGAYVYTDGTTSNGLIGVNLKTTQCCIPGVKIQNFQLYNPSSFCQQVFNSTPAPPLLAITQADIGAWPTNPSPFYYTGPYAVEVYNNVFNCGQGGSQKPSAGILVTSNSTADYSNDIYVHGNFFEWSTVGFYGGDYLPSQCDAYFIGGPFRDNRSVNNPRNIVINNNSWRDAGQGALTLTSPRWVQVISNTFTDDQYVHDSGTDQGGAIFVDQCVDTVYIYSNTMTGPGGTAACNTPSYCLSKTQGIEAYGRNVTVSTNTIANYYYEGVSASNIYYATIDHNTMHDNGWSAYVPYGPVHIWDNLNGARGGRQGTLYYVQYNKIGNASQRPVTYGITLNGPTPTPTNITIVGNTSYGSYGQKGPQCYQLPWTLSNGVPVGVVSDDQSGWPLCQ